MFNEINRNDSRFRADKLRNDSYEKAVMHSEKCLSTFKIKEHSKAKFVIERSKLENILWFTLFIIFWSFLLSSVLPIDPNDENIIDSTYVTLQKEPMLVLFLLLPLFLLKKFFNFLKIITFGENVVFDGESKKVYKSSKQICNFEVVEKVQIRLISGIDSADQFRLSLVLNDGTKIFIEESNVESIIKEIAEGIAEIIDVSVIFKG